MNPDFLGGNEFLLIFIGAIALLVGGAFLLASLPPFENDIQIGTYITGIILVILGILAEILVASSTHSKIVRNQKQITELKDKIKDLEDRLDKNN